MKPLILILAILYFPIYTYGQYKLRRLNPNNTIDSFQISPENVMYNWNGELYFIGYDSSVGLELFVLKNHTTPVAITDMTAPGQRYLGLEPSRHLSAITSIGNKLYFTGYNSNTGIELWEYDGINAPKLACDINPGSANGFPANFLLFNGKLYFSGCFSGLDNTLGVFDPATNIATQLLPPTPQFSLPVDPYELTLYNNKIYFGGRHPSLGTELYEYDPATTGYKTFDIYPLNKPWGNESRPRLFTVFNNKLYFTAGDTVIQNRPLFEFDGINFPKALNIGYILTMGVFNNKLYLNAFAHGKGYELHEFTPLNNSAILVHDINKTDDGNPVWLCTHNNKMYFSGCDTAKNHELWNYNGIDPPTLVYDIRPGIEGSFPAMFTPVDTFLYFYTTEPSTGRHTGVRTIKNKAIAILYPNPVTNTAHLQFTLDQALTLNISIFDLQGRILYKTGDILYSAAKHTIDIPLQNLPAGNYVYSLQDMNGSMLATGKLVKQ